MNSTFLNSLASTSNTVKSGVENTYNTGLKELDGSNSKTLRWVITVASIIAAVLFYLLATLDNKFSILILIGLIVSLIGLFHFTNQDNITGFKITVWIWFLLIILATVYLIISLIRAFI